MQVGIFYYVHAKKSANLREKAHASFISAQLLYITGNILCENGLLNQYVPV